MDKKIWGRLTGAEREACLSRPARTSSAGVESAVREIMERVRREGDRALMEYSRRLDHFEGERLELTAAERAAARERVSPELKAAIDQALKNIRLFHAAQKPQAVRLETFPGIVCETRSHPIEAVGLYVPGGSAPLVSTALMLAVPAQIAGCPEVILCSPPPIADPIVYAATEAGVRRIFSLGGAQAVAAMAYGTESVPRVLKIFGPGNQYVTMAKRLAASDPAGAAMDMPAGPSEVLVIADAGANPRYVALDLLSQAEHGPDSQAILVSLSEPLIDRVLAELERELATLPRAAIARRALSQSTAIAAASLAEAAAIANAYAPEHLILQLGEPEAVLGRLRNAGSIFVGAYTPESLGDYASGTNHTLPTYGYARTCSALGTDDYRRRYTVQRASRAGLKAIGPTVEALARAESLEAHRRAIAVRTESEE